MKRAKRTLAAELDGRLQQIARLRPSRPPFGWSRQTREATGITLMELGKRLAMDHSSVRELELNEMNGRITLTSLGRLASALDCDLLYAFVPKDGFVAMVERVNPPAPIQERRRRWA